jgi:transposase
LDTNFWGFFMTKYNEQFKLSVVQQYLSGTAGYKLIGQLHGLDYSMVKRWVDLYRRHGPAGLAKKFSHYNAEYRLAVLRHMWDKELSCREVAAVFNIRNAASVGLWERCYHSGGIDALTPRVRGRPQKMPNSKPPEQPLPADDEARSRAELLSELNHLRMENAYLKKLRALVQAQQQQRATARKKRK